MDPFDTVNIKKERRPGVYASRGNGFNAAVFSGTAPG